MQWAQKQKGFTIVELLIVVVVIAILASITIVAYNGIQSRTRMSGISSEMRNVVTKLQEFNAKVGSYPANATDLESSNMQINPTFFVASSNRYVYCRSADGTNAGIVASTSEGYYSFTTANGLKSMTTTEWGGSPSARCESAVGPGGVTINGITGTDWAAWVGAS
jgi:prepilin-type N-terminal cleavage/methylation domain-containing protein